MRFLVAILFIFLSLTAPVFAQTGEDEELDSLIAVYHSMSDNDTAKLSVCDQIALDHFNVDSTILWGERLLSLTEKHKSLFYKSRALHYLSWAYYYQNNYDESMRLCFEGIRLAEAIHDYFNCGNHYRILSANNEDLSDYKLAQDYIDSAKYYYYLIGDSATANTVNDELFRIYHDMCAFDLADSILDVIIKYDLSVSELDRIVRDYSSKMELYLSYYDTFYGTADISWVLKSKLYVSKILGLNYTNSYMTSFFLKLYVKSLFYELDYYKYTGKRRNEVVDSLYILCTQMSDVVKNVDAEDADFDLAISWSRYYLSSHDYSKAKQILDSLSIDNFSTILNLMYRIYYTEVGDYDNALLYASKYSRDLLEQHSPMDIVNCTKHQAQRDFEDERERMKLAEAEKLFRIRVYYMAAIALAVLVALFLFYRYIRKRKHFNELNERNIRILQQNEEINLQKEEILSQRDELAEKNKQITDSINYASNIQNASLPKPEVMQELFHDYFLIYRPLHIVAGDFYWANRVGRYHVLVCADCTGHGVPGAFVSMLGISLLNEVAVNLSGEIKASEILDTLEPN